MAGIEGLIALGAQMVDASSRGAASWARFDRLAGNLFLLLSVIAGVVALTVISLGQSATIDPAWLEEALGRPIVIACAVGVALVDVGLFYGLSVGLDRGAAWARPAAVSVLMLLTVLGLAQVVIDLGRGRLTIPLAAILAIWVLSTRPGRVAAAQGHDRIVSAAIVLLGTATLLPTVLPWWWVPW